MMRLIVLLLVLALFGAGLTACEDQETSTQAQELGIPEGQRPKDKEKRPPPGPQEGGFQEGDVEGSPDTPPPPPDN